MPRLPNRFVKDKDPEDLSILIKKLLITVEKSGGLDSFDKINKELLKNIFSYNRKIRELSQQEINLLWESVSHLINEILKKKTDDVLDFEKRSKQIQKEKPLLGKYWIFPIDKGVYIKCDDHISFCKNNSEIFIDKLKLDKMDFIKAINSSGDRYVALSLMAGAIIGNFIYDGERKVGKFQLCQRSLPWLKNILLNMPIIKSHIRIVALKDEYNGESDGIYFLYRRQI